MDWNPGANNWIRPMEVTPIENSFGNKRSPPGTTRQSLWVGGHRLLQILSDLTWFGITHETGMNFYIVKWPENKQEQ